MKKLLLSISVLAISASAFAEQVHIYKCHGTSGYQSTQYVAVSAASSNNTAFIADDLCKALDSNLGANGINAVTTNIENLESVASDNLLLASIHSGLVEMRAEQSNIRNAQDIYDIRRQSNRRNSLDRRCEYMTLNELYNNGLIDLCI